jgi:hypothetical protein
MNLMTASSAMLFKPLKHEVRHRHRTIIMNFVRFEVSTAVTMMIIIFWEMTPCGSVFYESLPIQELTTSLCNLLTLVHLEDGGDTILLNVGSYKSHTVSSPRR